MDDYTRSWFEKAFECIFLRQKGNEFQQFFGDLMEKRYPDGDFIRVRPWGKVGDRKNDGYLKSERTLFQVYAPNEMKASEATKKIDDDFNGALPYWEKYFDRWVFVHNARDGIGPDITTKLLDLDDEHENITIRPWGFNDLRKKLFELSDEDIAGLLGPAPSLKDFLQLGFEDLQVVLKFISRQQIDLLPDLFAVPREKIKINKLSDETASLINAGRYKSTLVGRFFEQYPDPSYGDQIVQAFSKKYESLKKQKMDPDTIFLELQLFAGGGILRSPKHQAAVLSVLSYLFDQCDIFEPSENITQ